ncbi:eCIS core domain-containing protein [Crocosphaera sp.]|uniref:eCIS core domain-containing protein n=1 Tax=Crocosphaera sp. TaxID=2729996 RepID=UPI003F1FD028|nr:DUF4157 domain-containing protein [Crocosphaera sp.]
MVFERPSRRESQQSKLSSPRNVFQRKYLSPEEEQAFYNRPIHNRPYERTNLLPDAPYTPPVQEKADESSAAENEAIIQEKSEEEPNRTGLPDRLKTGVENLSGYSLDDVRVHYNSPKPAQLQALAYTQGTDIHVAPGQEQHLPHEAWHVVQQMQGRVKPTMQMKGVQINDDEGLEREADVMGEKVLFSRSQNTSMSNNKSKKLVDRLSVKQFAKGGKKEGTFIGDEAAIHLHIDIGNPHLKINGFRIDIKGNDFLGYSISRLRDALQELTTEDKQAVSGAEDCKDWIETQLKGEQVPPSALNMPGSVVGSEWGKGLIIAYPAKPFGE